ncbi:aspartate-semialdehyde dehydrogenase [Anaplasma phagocytophilum]|uniref:Semialdehyde dehydrogenase, NAD binding domain protein n=3 Tax=Anaplasma phagocytophilum TaxID=948 RepID=A0A0F3NJR5_ANAPH|nr:aspartate-semialdehyde dehydrogenase [Anaplasma phagocytophilum]ABD43528.1 putative aspartate-semialdehyde dehydrogenase [Anaplasma phagocytophilum str. HZ]AGR79141.1 aspartate-semialdehyde dehydrogenase [Anaplasma phagocytophilum str. HZ2]AGR80389.1 aspartate-semialdehyde dehydrogenase [Anaplasma phagocytophilum str. JM]AGR81643.1 aspartate-semialdehyde dehydrogenase [Anaplasma phagocytophilum str. Dog2]EOA61554.1 putative aspartate-semialdehyde dehydrogenase [Anaplasma phagocytophilum str
MDHIIAVVGATTMLGRVVLNALSEADFSYSNVVALSYSDSVGKSVSYGEKFNLTCESLDKYDFSQASIAIFTATDAISERYVREAAGRGCVVIDSSSFSRMEAGVPLIVPGVNSACIGMYKDGNIIATPCSMASQLIEVLFPLHKLVKIERVVVSTYHSVSHACRSAMNELYDQTKSIFMNGKVKPREFPRQVSFNCIPCVGEFADGDFTQEEVNISNETVKVLGGGIGVTATCVFVPVFVAHSAVINVEFSGYISKDEILEAWGQGSDVLVIEKDSEMSYTTPIECVNDSEVYVSRFRVDDTVPYGFSMWLVADNMSRTGRGLVQIAMVLIEEYLL